MGLFLSYTATAQPVPSGQPPFMVENFGMVATNVIMPSGNFEFTINEAQTYLYGHLNFTENLHYSNLRQIEETYVGGQIKAEFNNFELMLLIKPKDFKTHRYKV